MADENLSAGGYSFGSLRDADLAREEKLSGEIRLYDIDKKAAENNEKIGNHISSRKEAVGKWKYVVKDTLKALGRLAAFWKNHVSPRYTVGVTGSGHGVTAVLVAGMSAVAVIHDHVAYQDFGGADVAVEKLDAKVADEVFRMLHL